MAGVGSAFISTPWPQFKKSAVRRTLAPPCVHSNRYGTGAGVVNWRCHAHDETMHLSTENRRHTQHVHTTARHSDLEAGKSHLRHYSSLVSLGSVICPGVMRRWFGRVAAAATAGCSAVSPFLSATPGDAPVHDVVVAPATHGAGKGTAVAGPHTNCHHVSGFDPCVSVSLVDPVGSRREQT